MNLVVTLMCEWREAPLWVSRDGGIADPYEVDEISEMILLDDSLLRDVADWDARFQATYQPTDPARSGFATNEEKQKFLADGRVLAQRLRDSVDRSAVSVEYAGDGSIEVEPVGPPENVVYYAKIDETHPRTDPRGIVRRRIADGTAHDEAFTRNLRWEPTEYLRRYELGHNDVEHVEISIGEAEEFVQRMTRELSL